MKQDSKSVGHWLIRLIALLLLGVPFAAFYLFRLPARETYLAERGFRQLGDVGDQIERQVANLSRALASATQTGAEDPEQLTNSLAQIRPKPNILRFETNSATTNLTTTLTNTPVTGGFGLQFTYPWQVRGGSTRAVFVVGLTELLRGVMELHAFDDLLLVDTKGEGLIIYQETQAGSRLTNASGVVSATRIARLPDFSAQPSTTREPLATSNVVTYATSLGQLSVSGISYKCFSRPLELSCFGGKDAGASTVKWLLLGLVRADRFSREARKLPSTYIIFFGFAVSLALLSWPFLDILFARPREELRRLQVAAVFVSAGLSCGAFALLVVDLGTYAGAELHADQPLEYLSRAVLDHFTNELSLAYQQLEELNRAFAQRASCTDTNRTAWLANCDRDQVTVPYPYFTMATWIDTNGQQLAKWTTASHTTAFIPVADREYFKAILEERTFPLPCSGECVFPVSEAFFLEPIFSWTRALNSVELSARFTNTTKHFCVPLPAVAALEFRPLSLFRPVIPLGYGFSLIDLSGRVLFHSDERRNLRENFFQEIEPSPKIRAAALARVTDTFELKYRDQTHRLRITPVPGLPWCLVTFRNEEYLSIAHGNWIAAGTLLFGLWVALILALWALIAFVQVVRGSFQPQNRPFSRAWAWPDKRRESDYLWILVTHATATLTLVAVLLFVRRTPILMLCAVVVPLLAGLIDARWLHRKPSQKAKRCSPQRCRSLFVLCLGTACWVTVMLPLLLWHKASFVLETNVLIKATERQLAAELRQRAEALRQEYRGQPQIEMNRQANEWRWDQKLPPPVIQAASTNPAAITNILWLRLTNSWDRYEAEMFHTQVAAPETNGPSLGQLVEPSLSVNLYSALRHGFEPLTLPLRGLLRAAAEDGSWLCLESNKWLTMRLPGTDQYGNPGGLQIRAEVVPFVRLPGSESLWVNVGMLFLLLATTCVPFPVMGFIARRVFLIDMTSDSAKPDATLPESNPQILALSNLSASSGTSPDTESKFWAAEPQPVDIGDLGQAKEADLLAATSATEYPAGVILVGKCPRKGSQEQQDKINKVRASVHEDRSKTLVIFLHPPGSGSPEARGPLLTSFWHIEAPSPHLSKAEALPADKFCEAVRRTLLAWCIQEWGACTPEEKLVLYQVARNGLAHPSQSELHKLLKRGLLSLAPDLRVGNDVFKRYVLAAFDPRQIADQTKDAAEPDSATRWRLVKTTAGVALTTLALFLFLTQRDLWQLGVSLATAFATGLGQLSNLASLYTKEGSKEKS